MPRPTGLALQLSRIGAQVSADFAERLAPLGLTPAQVGVLRVVAQSPGLSQQELAGRIGAVPSRVTKLVDELEDAGLVERVRSSSDRRNVELRLAGVAGERLGHVRRVVAAHDARLVAALDADELVTLLGLLDRVAAALGLGDDVHAGYAGGSGSHPSSGRPRPL